MSYYMRQVTLQRGQTRTVSWIPEKFAKVGKILDLKEDTESWSISWKVISIGSRMKADEVIERSRDYKHQRKASDI